MGANGKMQRATAQRAARIAEALRLRRDFGMTDKQIAKQMGLGVTTIQRYFSQTMAQWRKAVPMAVEAARAQSDARLTKLLEECLAEYERSKQPMKKVIQEREAVPGVKPQDWPVVKTRTEMTDRCGDTAYIEKALRAIDMHIRLFGLYKPVPQELDVNMEGRIASVFALVQYAEERSRPENLPTVISADGREMVRGPDGVPMLPGDGGNGKPANAEGDDAGAE